MDEDQITIPEDLSTLSDEDLAAAITAVAAEASGLAGEAATDDSALERIEALAVTAARLDAERVSREEAATARAERLAAATAAFPAAAATEVEPESVVTDDEPEPEVVVPAPSAGALAVRRPPAAAAPEAHTEPSFTIVRSGRGGRVAGTALQTLDDLAQEITDRRLAFNVIPEGVSELLSVAGMRSPEATGMLSANYEANMALIEAATREFQGLLASGAPTTCTPSETRYDFFRTAVAQNPVESALPGVPAPRGSIRYIVNCGLNGAEDGISVYDHNVGGTKPNVSPPCPTVVEDYVRAITQIVQFDNLQYRVFPELVRSFLQDVDVAFTETKEIFYLDRIKATSTGVSATAPYGASRGVFAVWNLAATALRRRLRMPQGAPVTMFQPTWMRGALLSDLVLDQTEHVETLQAAASFVDDYLAKLGLATTWINDGATGSAQEWRPAQASGTLNPYLDRAEGYLFAPGTYVRMEGGDLNVGLVRDSVLNSTNDLQLFEEEWIGLMKPGCESIRLVTTFHVNGTGPVAQTAVNI